MSHIEEINIVREGLNYGWMQREGFFANGVTTPGGVLNQVFPLAGGDLGRAETGRVHLPRGDLRPTTTRSP